MNEVFEKLSDVFEELRSEADEREYSIQTELLSSLPLVDLE